MQSENKPAMTVSERRHVARVKSLPCSVCDVPGQSEAHEIKQGSWFLSVALCPQCHRDPRLGLHGQKAMWKIKKMDELDALAVTIRRLQA